MLKKLSILVLAVCFTTNVFSAYTWDNDSADNMLDTLSNWDPDLAGWIDTEDYIVDDTDNLGGAVLVDNTVDVAMNRFKMGSVTAGNAAVDMTGGIIAATRIYMGEGGSAMNVTFDLSGGELRSSKNVNFGFSGAEVTFNMSGGLLQYKDKYGYTLYIGKDNLSTVNFNLSGGEVRGDDLVIDALGTLDITGGKMIFTGDDETYLEGLYSSGKITNSSGEGLDITFADGVTTVELVPEPACIALLGIGSIFLRRRK